MLDTFLKILCANRVNGIALLTLVLCTICSSSFLKPKKERKIKTFVWISKFCAKEFEHVFISERWSSSGLKSDDLEDLLLQMKWSVCIIFQYLYAAFKFWKQIYQLGYKSVYPHICNWRKQTCVSAQLKITMFFLFSQSLK